MITLQGGLLATLSRVFGHLNVLQVGAVVALSCLWSRWENALGCRDDLLCFLGIRM